MKARSVRPLRKWGTKEFFPTGHVFDDPKAFLLVQFGHAVPADDECAAKVRLSPAQLARLQQAGAMAAAGIHPDDRQAFLSGEMTGYHPDGSYIPGPNFVPPAEEDDDLTDEILGAPVS